MSEKDAKDIKLFRNVDRKRRGGYRRKRYPKLGKPQRVEVEKPQKKKLGKAKRKTKAPPVRETKARAPKARVEGEKGKKLEFSKEQEESKK